MLSDAVRLAMVGTIVAAGLAAIGGAVAGASGKAPSAPTVAAAPPKPLHVDAARVDGSVDPNGLQTTYRFEYGRTSAYGAATTTRSAGSGTAPVGVSARITGLRPGTTYHYTLTASNLVGSAQTPDATFRTLDPRLRGHFEVRLHPIGGDALGGANARVVHRRYRFSTRCDGPLCHSVRLVRAARKGHFRSVLAREGPGVYAGTERFRGGRCDDGLRFHSRAPLRIAVTSLQGDRAQSIGGRFRLQVRGCVDANQHAHLTGRRVG